MGRDPVNLFLDGSLVGESAALQNCLAVLDHFGMTAQVGHRVARIQFPVIGILAQDVVRAADFSRPVGVIPGTADRGHIFEPRQFFSELVQFIQVSELPGAARTV